MSVWGELILIYVLNAYWQGMLVAGVAWMLARWLRGAGPAAVCWVWRVAMFTMVLLPMGSTVWVLSGRDAVAVADGTGEGSRVWLALAGFCGLTIVWRAVRVFADWRAVGRGLRYTAAAALPGWAEEGYGVCSGTFRAGEVAVLRGRGDAAYTAGWPKASLVLPERYFGEAEVPGLVSIVGHEMAHIERRDYAWNLLLEAVTTLVAFHPAVPWMKGYASLAREEACDALVVQRLVPAVDYADDLLRFAGASMQTALPRQVMTVLERDSLEVRLRSLLYPARLVSARAAIWRAGVVLLAAGMVMSAVPWRALRVDFAPVPEVGKLVVWQAWAVPFPPPPPPPPPPLPH